MHRAKYVGKGTEISMPSLRELLSTYLHVFINLKALQTLSFLGYGGFITWTWLIKSLAHWWLNSSPSPLQGWRRGGSWKVQPHNHMVGSLCKQPNHRGFPKVTSLTYQKIPFIPMIHFIIRSSVPGTELKAPLNTCITHTLEGSFQTSPEP